ncbi:MAG: histidine triad nucleotide-binding protein [FCB group bacterium]|nr:histidine triad nucleotide-binding protein [FCB group bacterium]
MEKCLFCEIAKGNIPATIEYEDENVIAFRDINPQAPIHILIIPRDHIPTVNDLTPDHQAIIAAMFQAVQKLTRDNKIDHTGYRTVFNCNRDGGQDVYHLHLHVLGGRKMTWPPG